MAATWLAGLEDSLLELFLVEPQLRAFPDDSLTPFKRLEAVTLQCGEMQRLPRLAGLPRLRYVLVQSAMLWELPPGHLASLPYLEQLHVVSTRAGMWPAGYPDPCGSVTFVRSHSTFIE